jgi:hypothetical protein
VVGHEDPPIEEFSDARIFSRIRFGAVYSPRGSSLNP